MARSFDRAVLDAAESEQEVGLTTFDQVTNKPARITVEITPNGEGLYLRSDTGMDSEWALNLAAHARGILHIGGADVPFTARHVTDLAEAQSVSRACAEKYQRDVQPAQGDRHTPAETGTFELLPVEG